MALNNTVFNLEDAIALIPHLPDDFLLKAEREMRKTERQTAIAGTIHLGLGLTASFLEFGVSAGLDPGLISLTLTALTVGGDASAFSNVRTYLKALRRDIEKRGLECLRLGVRGRLQAYGKGLVGRVFCRALIKMGVDMSGLLLLCTVPD